MSTAHRQTTLLLPVVTLFLFVFLGTALSVLPVSTADAPAAVGEVSPEIDPSAALADWPTFEDSGIMLPGAFQGAKAWGDYDGDGDLDIVMTSGYAFSQIFRNDGDGVFTDIDAGLETVNGSSVAWGDYDRDGDLDLLLVGADNDNRPISRIYRNDAEDTFTDIDAGLVGVWSFPVTAWGDYDNDGDLDALLAGNAISNESIAKLYRNDGDDTFTDTELALLAGGASMDSMAWGDYDNDDDLDMLYSGWSLDNESNAVTRIYRNDGGVFTDAGIPLEGVNQSDVAWGDYDADGDLDILLAGYSNTLHEVTRVYRNDGGGVFTDINAALIGLARGVSAAWGDYDNDGDLDILLSGCAEWDDLVGLCYADATLVYRNDDGAFVELDLTSSHGVEWGDYDNDGDLDILATHVSVTRILRNNTESANTLPSAPGSLRVSLLDGARFEWDAADDAETASPGLHYNLRVGTAPGGIDVVAPMATEGGYRQVVELGNAHQGLSAHLKGLPPGTYYWSVQAIDGAFAGSPFAVESSFTLHGAFPVYLPVFLP